MPPAPDQPVQARYSTNTGRWEVLLGSTGWVAIDPQKQGELQRLSLQGLVQVVPSEPAAPATPTPAPVTPAPQFRDTSGDSTFGAVSQYPTAANAAGVGPAIGAYNAANRAPAPAAPGDPTAGSAMDLLQPGANPNASIATGPVATSAAEEQARQWAANGTPVGPNTPPQPGAPGATALPPPPGVAWENDWNNPARHAGGVVPPGGQPMAGPQQSWQFAPPVAGLPPRPVFDRFAAGGQSLTGMEPIEGEVLSGGAPPPLAPPPGMDMGMGADAPMGMGDPNAITGEGGDALPGGSGLELVIMPAQGNPGLYRVFWTDAPTAVTLENETTVHPVEETGPSVKAIKETYPKLEGEELLKRGGQFLGKASGRQYAKGGRARGIARPPGVPAPVPVGRYAEGGRVGPVAPIGLPGATPSAAGGVTPWWNLTQTIYSPDGSAVNPYQGLSPTGIGNYSLFQQNDAASQKRIDQDLIQRGILGGADWVRGNLRRSAPGQPQTGSWMG